MSHLVLKTAAKLHVNFLKKIIICFVPFLKIFFFLLYQPAYQFDSVPEIPEKWKTLATNAINQEGKQI